MSDDQKEIGAILIEMNDKNIDRFISLIEFAVAVFALYVSITAYKLEYIIKSLQIINWNVIFCFTSLTIAICFSISQIQNTGKRTALFKNNGGLIQFKNEQELLKQNEHLFLSINTQNDTFIGSFLLIVCSLGFSFNFLLPDNSHFLQDILFIVLFIMFVISIAFKYRGNLKALCRRQENEITS